MLGPIFHSPCLHQKGRCRACPGGVHHSDHLQPMEGIMKAAHPSQPKKLCSSEQLDSDLVIVACFCFFWPEFPRLSSLRFPGSWPLWMDPCHPRLEELHPLPSQPGKFQDQFVNSSKWNLGGARRPKQNKKQWLLQFFVLGHPPKSEW